MDYSNLVELVAAALCVSLCVLLIGQNLRHKKRLPPGSMGWPIVGQTLEFIKPSPAQELEPFIDKGRRRYGKVFLANLFWGGTIVSTDAEVNKFVLQNEGRLFRSYLPRPFRKLFGEHAVGLVGGDAHRLYRGLIVAFLKSKLPHIIPHIEAAALSTIRSWKHDSTVSFLHEAKTFLFICLGTSFLSLNQEEIQQVQEHYKVFEKGLMSLPIAYRGTKFGKALQARANLVHIFQKQIDERRKTPSNNQDDMLDFLISKGDLPEEAINDLFISLFFATQDTTSRALTSIVKLLKQSPPSFEELLKEHMEIQRTKSKGEGLTMEDYLKMSFTQKVINEALRTVNPNLGLFRIALDDVEIKGYLIPKGYKVYMSQSSTHLDGGSFPNPTSFDPFRWKHMDATSISLFKPFGGGMRLCPGAELARLDMAIFLHYFLTTYDWEFSEHDDIIHQGMLTFPKGLPITLKSRN